MIFASVLASAALLSAQAVSAQLSVKVAATESLITDVDTLQLTATLTNTGSKSLKLFNDPKSIISSFPAETFDVVGATGGSPDFLGAHAKYTFTHTGKSDKAFTVLGAGESISVIHDLAGVYNFTTSGAGSYTLTASPLFHALNEDGSVVKIHARQEAFATVSLSGKLASSRLAGAGPFRPASKFVGCNANQQSLITTALKGTTTYLSGAVSYLQSINGATARYTAWFGAYSASRKALVLDHYTKIKNSNPTTYTIDCTCTEDYYAYVYPQNFGYVYVCNAFWQAPSTGTDSKAGTIVHESSHFTKNGGTQDYQYGQTAAKALAKSNPSQATMNADSHEYFAENNPAQK